MVAAPAGLSSIMIGEIKLTYLPDGVIHGRPMEQYPNSTVEHWTAHPQFLDADGWLIMTMGSILVETSGRKILVDLAWGPRSVRMEDTSGGMRHGDMIGGALLSSLRQAGMALDDIDSIMYSHLHPDHLGWACHPDGRPVFVNATHYVSEIEWHYWLAGPEAHTPIAPNEAQRAAMSDRLELISDDSCLAPGVNYMMTPGHTPGHASLVISSGTARAVILGDAIHCPIEIEALELDFVSDVDAALARRTKELIMRELEDPNTVVAGGHFPDLIFGRMVSAAARRYVQLVA